MLTAQTRELEPEMAPPTKSPAPTAQGFGRVLTSIQGLQKRLDDFSFDEVSRAETDAKNLIQQISALQTKLQRLAELKTFVVSANSLISEIPSENFDGVVPDGLANHPQLHAIVQASKLIRFHRIMKAAKAGAESISFDAEAGVLNFASAAPREAITSPGPELSPAPLTLDSAHWSAPSFKAPPEPATTKDAATEIEAEPTAEEQDWIFSPEPERFDAAVVTDHVFDLAAADSQVNRTSDLLEKPQTDNLAEAHETPVVKTKGSQPEIHFDQRLLTDLIETYGEFTAAPKSPVAIEAPQAIESECLDFQMVPVPVQTPKHTQERSPERQASSASVPQTLKPESRETLPVTITAAEPKESEPFELLAIAPPEASEAKPEANEERRPAVRRHGELDRQLKSIIKDYGEYDLYSHRSTVNFKTAVIAAFAVLGLLLGGFYFFRVPAVPTPAAVTSGRPAGLPAGAKVAADSPTPDSSKQQ